MADTPRSGPKRKQQKQTLSPAGLTPLVTEEGNDSIIVSDSPPESQELKRRQRKAENALKNEKAGNDLDKGQVAGSSMAADVNKQPGELKEVVEREQQGETEQTVTISEVKEREKGDQTPNELPIGLPRGHLVEKTAEQTASSTVEELLGKVPTRAKRGRPRKRGLSVDPILRQGSDDMMTVLLGIRQDNAMLKTDILTNIDCKMSQFKVELAKDLGGLNEQVREQGAKLESIQRSQEVDRQDIKEMDSKCQELDEEIDMVRKSSIKEVRTVVEQLAGVEASLARDIESIRVSAEEKFEETKKHQMLAEDRLQEISTSMVKDNELLKLELEQMKSTLDQLQQANEESDANTRYSTCSVESDTNRSNDNSGTGSLKGSETMGSYASSGSSASTLYSVPELIL